MSDASSCVLAGFVSAPNLTAAAAAQNLTWAPVSVTSVNVVFNTVAMDTDSAVIALYLTADLGVSGDITDVAPRAGDRDTSRRKVLQDNTGGTGYLGMSCAMSAPHPAPPCWRPHSLTPPCLLCTYLVADAPT